MASKQTIQKKLKAAFSQRTNAKELSKADYKAYEAFQEERTLNLTTGQIKTVCEIYHRAFNWKKKGGKTVELGNVWVPTNLTTSSMQIVHGMIEKLDIVVKIMKE